MNARARIALAACLVAAAAAAPGPAEATSPACPEVKYGGKRYVLYTSRVGCDFAIKWVKRLHRSKGRREPDRYRCRSGSNFKTGGDCRHRRKNKQFGWHPYD